MSDFIPPAYAKDIFKHGMALNVSWELLYGYESGKVAIYRSHSRWWLLQRRVTNWALFRLLKWAERKEFVQGGDCYECAGYPEPTTEKTYFVGYEDDGR